MILTNKISMDLQPQNTPVVNAVQSDSYSRRIEISLYSDGEPFLIPDDASAIIRYRTLDGKGGEYDTLPDGTLAWSAEANVLTVTLAPQVLSAPGSAALSVSLMKEERQLSTFPILLNVQPLSAAEDPESGNYIFVTGYLPAPGKAQVGQYLQISSVSPHGKVTGVKAVDAINNGSSDVDSSQIQSAVEDYMQKNPPVTEECDPSVPSWAKQSSKPGYTASEVGADPSGTAASVIHTHDDSADSHPDIRQELSMLSDEKAATAYVDERIAVAITGKTQLEANFSSSIEECTDTSKVYVLPDGYIYAYTEKRASYLNQIPISTDASGNIYNGKGYKEGTRVDSLYSETAVSGMCSTGFIPVKNGDVVRVKNVTLSGAKTSYLLVYDSDKVGFNALSVPASGRFEAADEDGVYTYEVNLDNASLAYMRLSCGVIDDSSIFTVNQEIKGSATGGKQWANTGHAFVPADYEDRIIDLEETTAQHTDEIKTLNALVGSGGSDPTADYVADEAERVAKEVLSKQNANTFSFLAIADAHYLSSNASITASVLHAGQGMNLVRRGAHIDFGVVLGDNGWGSGVEGSANRATIEMGIEEIRATNKLIDESLRGIPNFRTPGNHCGLVYNYAFNGNAYLDGNALFPLYGAYNTGAVYPDGEKSRGCCYRDFEEFKVRVICLNTSDTDDVAVSDGASIYISGTQLKWLAETLDLSGKADADQWGILLLSHCPLDWGNCIVSTKIIKAYLDGTSVTLSQDGVTVSYDYAGKNGAALIANIHGHTHGFKVDSLHYLDDSGTARPLMLRRIAIPNACFSRSNEYGQNSGAENNGIEFGEETTYGKTAGTAEDTAFCVVTVDTAARKIYATHYGAGYDREINY